MRKRLKKKLGLIEYIHVVKFISYDEAEGMKECGIGGMGGWFDDGMRWPTYAEMFTRKGLKYLKPLRRYIVRNRIQITGEQTQNSSKGVPLFSDGTVATYSWRAWGDLMAAIWSTEDNRDCNYMWFYM